MINTLKLIEILHHFETLNTLRLGQFAGTSSTTTKKLIDELQQFEIIELSPNSSTRVSEWELTEKGENTYNYFKSNFDYTLFKASVDDLRPKNYHKYELIKNALSEEKLNFDSLQNITDLPYKELNLYLIYLRATGDVDVEFHVDQFIYKLLN